MFRPLKPVHVTVETEPEETKEEKNLPLLQRIKLARDTMRNADSTFSLENDIGITAAEPAEINKFLKANNNVTYPTVAEVLNASTRSISKSRSSLNSHKNHIIKSKTDLNEPEKRLSIPIFNDIINKNEKKHSVDYEMLKEFTPNDALLSEHDEKDKKHKAATNILSDVRRDSITLKFRTRTTSECSHRSGVNRSRRNTLSKIDAGVRPLYRDDIFLQGSLSRLPQYASKV
jgi:hypothetical protein